MTTRHRLPIAALLLAALCFTEIACAPPEASEDVAQEMSALNGHSTPPDGGFQFTGINCYVGYPMTSPWPAGSYCDWSPNAAEGAYPPFGTRACVGSAPGAGKLWLYQYSGFGGNCAEVYSPYGTTPYQFDSDLVQLYGWTNTYEGIYGPGSMKLGPYTNLLLCAGPLTGPGGAPCNQYRMMGFGSFAQGAVYPSIYYSDGSPFTIAAIQISATQ